MPAIGGQMGQPWCWQGAGRGCFGGHRGRWGGPGGGEGRQKRLRVQERVFAQVQAAEQIVVHVELRECRVCAHVQRREAIAVHIELRKELE